MFFVVGEIFFSLKNKKQKKKKKQKQTSSSPELQIENSLVVYEINEQWIPVLPGRNREKNLTAYILNNKTRNPLIPKEVKNIQLRDI